MRIRVLLDECIPVEVVDELSKHDLRTIRGMQWRGKKNGELLRLAAENFNVFVTIDQGLPFQQHVAKLKTGCCHARRAVQRDGRAQAPHARAAARCYESDPGQYSLRGKASPDLQIILPAHADAFLTPVLVQGALRNRVKGDLVGSQNRATRNKPLPLCESGRFVLAFRTIRPTRSPTMRGNSSTIAFICSVSERIRPGTPWADLSH